MLNLKTAEKPPRRYVRPSAYFRSVGVRALRYFRHHVLLDPTYSVPSQPAPSNEPGGRRVLDGVPVSEQPPPVSKKLPITRVCDFLKSPITHSAITGVALTIALKLLPFEYALPFGGAFGAFYRVLRLRVEELKEQAAVDPMTGLLNRRSFHLILENELSRGERYSLPVTVVMVDIDHFKRFNDTFGHQFGDLVLVELAKLLKEGVRSTDVSSRFITKEAALKHRTAAGNGASGRYGGEEFILSLERCPVGQAAMVMERLRTAVETKLAANVLTTGGATIASTAIPEDFGVTISLGSATYAPGESILTSILIGRADAALYHAKESGRNRSIVWDSSLESH